MAGDGNKACYLATPKGGWCPTYEVSVLQFWIDRMIRIHTATHPRLKNYGKAAPVRVKHVMSCSYRGLVFLQQNLRNITGETYTKEFANKTHGYGACCVMSICDWRHARMDIEEHLNQIDDQDHMGHVEKFTFAVHETCLSCDHNIFMAPCDTDAQSTSYTLDEKHSYLPPAKKMQRKERRKDIQRSNKRKGLGDGPLLDSSWDSWDGRPRPAPDPDPDYGYGCGGSSASSS